MEQVSLHHTTRSGPEMLPTRHRTRPIETYGTGTMSTSTNRRRDKSRTVTQEEKALDSIAQQAEKVLADKKKEREKARRMRMEEVNKRQQEDEDQLDRQYELMQRTGGGANRTYPASQASYSSRRGSMDSTDSSNAESKDVRTQLSELQERYRRAMVSNAQLDNEKQGQSYNIELLKDRVEELEEHMKELALEAKDKSRALDKEKRQYQFLENDVSKLKYLLEQRDHLIKENGLVLMSGEDQSAVGGDASRVGSSASSVPERQRNGSAGSIDGADSSPAEERRERGMSAAAAAGMWTGEEEEETSPVMNALVSVDTAEKLKVIPGTTLESKLIHLISDSGKLKVEMKNLRTEMEEEREKASSQTPTKGSQMTNGSEAELQLLEYQRESSRIIAEYKLKVQKADNDAAALESNVQRLESQSRRLRDMMDEAERTEEELKGEKRKLQRELREALASKEEAESQRGHLQNRLDKIRQARREVLGQ